MPAKRNCIIIILTQCILDLLCLAVASHTNYSANDNVPPQMVNAQPQKGAIRPAINVFTITLIFRKGATRPAINAFTITLIFRKGAIRPAINAFTITLKAPIRPAINAFMITLIFRQWHKQQVCHKLVTETTCILQVTPLQLSYSNEITPTLITCCKAATV